MTYTDHIVKDRGGSIWVELLDATAPITSCTIAIEDSAGTSKLSATAATVSTLSTTLSGPARAGERVLQCAALASTDISPGQRIRIQPSQTEGQTLTCRERDEAADLIYTYEEIQTDLPHGAPVFGLRVTYTVAAAVANAIWSHGMAIWTPTIGTAQAPTVELLHCTLYALPDTWATLSDLQLVVPGGAVGRLRGESDDVTYQLRDARISLVRALLEVDPRTGSQAPVHTILGPATELRRLHALRWLLDRELNWGPAAGVDWLRVELLYQRELELVRRAQRDLDQDGANSVQEQGPLPLRVLRG